MEFLRGDPPNKKSHGKLSVKHGMKAYGTAVGHTHVIGAWVMRPAHVQLNQSIQCRGRPIAEHWTFQFFTVLEYFG
jgi:hypothetical protein